MVLTTLTPLRPSLGIQRNLFSSGQSLLICLKLSPGPQGRSHLPGRFAGAAVVQIVMLSVAC